MRLRNRRRWQAAGALVAGGLMLAGCSGTKEPETTPVVTVEVAPVLDSAIQNKITADALLFPVQQSAIVPKVTAPVKKFYVNRGDHVKAGQLLAELESRDLTGAATESQAAYAQAEAAFQTSARATVPEEVQKAELDVKAAKDALDAQQAVFDGRQSLFKEGAIAQKELNDAQVALVQARNQSEIAQKHLDNLQSFGTDQALKSAQALRDAAKGHSESSEAQLSYTRITSPIDGVVSDRPLFEGETPQSGAALLTVMDVSQVVAHAHITPAAAAEIKTGDAANLLIPNRAPVHGRVTQISPALDATGTTVEVWVQAPNPDGTLKPGTSVRVEVITQTVPTALVIPQTAILTSSVGATSVVVVDADNKPHKTTVTLGIRDAGSVQITEGLKSGQRVVTTGAFELAKLDADVLEKTKVQIQAAKDEGDDDDDAK
jgi:multidrug efflux pump subunit AcrA (membrane-fusion protein)